MRATLLGLMALLVVGSYAASSAYAEGGPWWHHRNNSEETQKKLVEGATENIQGKGGKQVLTGNLGKETLTAVEIDAESVQIKGILYNAGNQAQGKINLTYVGLKTPASGCTKVEVGTSGNTVHVEAWMAWKWDGTTKQLEEKPQKKVQGRDMVFFPTEPTNSELETGLAEHEFTTVILGPAGPCLLVGKYPVAGTAAANPVSPPNIGEFSKTEKLIINSESEPKQHVWNAAKKRYEGLKKLGLKMSGNPATLIGEAEIKAEAQEMELLEE